MVEKAITTNLTGKLRLAIVGLGKMGLLHLKTYQQFSEVSIAALVDIDAWKCKIADDHGVVFMSKCKQLVGLVDAAIIATPARTHAACALPLLEAGIHCFVEKPVALTLAETELLAAAAARSRSLLLIGQSERFNTALQRIRDVMNNNQVINIHVVRTASNVNSIDSEIDVVQDLMVHDLDWLIQEVGQMPSDVSVTNSHRVAGKLEEVACKLVFPDGRQVVIVASRIASRRQRTVMLQSPNQNHIINLGEHPDSELDPLSRQARAFLMAIRGQPSLIANSAQAMQIMTLVDQIRSAANEVTKPCETLYA